jgi:hypothetical protein
MVGVPRLPEPATGCSGSAHHPAMAGARWCVPVQEIKVGADSPFVRSRCSTPQGGVLCLVLLGSIIINHPTRRVRVHCV